MAAGLPEESDAGLYNEYARLLTPLDSFESELLEQGLDPAFVPVDLSQLTRDAPLKGKNGARVVLGAPSPPSRHVFKGMDFRTFLADHAGKVDFKEHQERTMLHEIRTLCGLAPHENIIAAPKMLVVIQDGEKRNRICGFLQPALERETVDDQVVRANSENRRMPLALKAKWCFQMAAAILHTHRVARNYHMDVKPGNMLVDDGDNIRLIDWEQSGVSMFTHAPEVTIDQAAAELHCTIDDKPKISYTPYDGPPRRNIKWGWPAWDVFPAWKRTCPRAAELAEVFSLGRTMWMLLEQVEQSPNPTVWTQASDDVPAGWKEVVMMCIEQDPNRRIGLGDLVTFWEGQMDLES